MKIGLKTNKLTVVLAGAAAIALASVAQATVTFYTDPTAFAAALAGKNMQTYGFEDYGTGDAAFSGGNRNNTVGSVTLDKANPFGTVSPLSHPRFFTVMNQDTGFDQYSTEPTNFLLSEGGYHNYHYYHTGFDFNFSPNLTAIGFDLRDAIDINGTTKLTASIGDLSYTKDIYPSDYGYGSTRLPSGTVTFIGIITDDASGFSDLKIEQNNINYDGIALDNIRFVSAVPEPSAIITMLSLGFLGFVTVRSRRRKAAESAAAAA